MYKRNAAEILLSMYDFGNTERGMQKTSFNKNKTAGFLRKIIGQYELY